MKKHTIKLLTVAITLAAILTLTGCPGPVNNYIEPEYTITVTVNDTEYGVAETDKTFAKVGETVTLTITPDSSYELESITLNGVALSSDTRTFTMPAENVVINVTFKTVDDDTESGDEPEQTTPEDTTENGEEEEETPVVDNGEEETEGDGTNTETCEHNYEGGYCEREGCIDPWQYANHLTVNVKKFGIDELEEVYFSFNTNTVEMNLNDLIHLKSRFVGYEVYSFTNANGDKITFIERYDNTEMSLFGSPIYILIKPITNE